MNGDILCDVLKSIKQKLKRNRQSILLFMDNAGCIPPDLEESYSNIKVMFLPPNTTSKLQLLDLGIIINFKPHYRKFLMRFVLAKIEECSTAKKVIKSLNILHAIRWTSQTWNEVTPDMIKKCFRKVGILNKAFEVVHRQEAEEDPFLDLDDVDDVILQVDDKTQYLITQLEVDDACTAEQLMFTDEDLAVCTELDDDTWEETILDEVYASSSKRLHSDFPGDLSNDESGEESDDDVPPPLVLKSYSEAVQALENVRHFL